MTSDGRCARIATYNLLHGVTLATGRVDLAAAADAIAALDADVVALQEIDRGLARSGGLDQSAWLGERLGYQSLFAPALYGNPDVAWSGVGTTDSGGPGYGVGLLSRGPLRLLRRVALPGGGAGTRRPGASPQMMVDAARLRDQAVGARNRLASPRAMVGAARLRDQAVGARNRLASPRYPGWDREPRVALVAHTDVAGATLRVTTTHLSYLPVRGLAQLRVAAAAAADGTAPAVLIGDLNLPAWPVRLALRGRWTHAGGQPTYPAWQPRLQVDQLLVRGGLQVTDVQLGARTTSDHLPLVARLRLP